MHHGNHSKVWWIAALALLAACSSDDMGDDDGGAGAPSPNTGGANSGGSSPGGSSAGGAGNASNTGGKASSEAGAASTGGRLGAFGGAPPSLGGAPGSQGGSPATQGGGPAASGGVTNVGGGAATLDSLNPDELGELCADAKASFDAAGVTETAGELTCRTAGIFAVVLFEPASDSELQQLCQETYDQCVAEPIETEDDCAGNSMCAATVSEFEACVNEYPGYLEQVAMGVPACSELTLSNLEESLGYEPEPTPACATLWDKCPEQAP